MISSCSPETRPRETRRNFFSIRSGWNSRCNRSSQYCSQSCGGVLVCLYN